MVKQDALTPRPNAKGPSVPAEKDKMLRLQANQIKKILWY